MPAPAFTTLARVKDWLRPASTVDDAFMTALIDGVTAAMIQDISRPILTASFSEVYNGNGQLRLPLRNFPITAVASLTINGLTVAAAPSTVTVGYAFDDLGLYLRAGQVFSTGPQNVAVSYTAGFATAPLDLDNGCAQQVAYEYRSRERMGESSKSLGPTQTVAYIVSPFLPRVRAILDTYKRRGMS
jgi:hypothetical protein